MSQTNQDISFNNDVSGIETRLDTVITNTSQDWTSVSSLVCDILGGGGSNTIEMVKHYRSGVYQSTEYRTLAGASYTVLGTLGVCEVAPGAPDYTTVLGDIETNTDDIDTSIGTVITTLGSTNTSLSNIETGITAINTKLNQTCAGSPLRVTVCNPTTVDFTSTNSILTTIKSDTALIDTGVSGVNTKITSTNTKLDTVNTTLSAINSKLNETCAGTPIKVEVCNQPSAFVDFTATNALLTDIKNLNTSMESDTNDILLEAQDINTALTTSNTHLSSIANVLSQSCAGTPLKVEVCNTLEAADFTATNAILTDIETNTDNTVTQTTAVNTKLTATNTKLDTVNTNLTTIANKLSETCAGNPIKVEICNPTSSSADFTATNAILTNMLSTENSILSDTSALNTKITTSNGHLSTIAGILGQTCAGTPLKVSVCNQISLTTMEASLASIDTKQSTIITNTGTIATNTGTTATNSATIVTNTANTKTSVDAVNTNITSLKTQLQAVNTNHVVVDNFPAAATNYNTNKLRTVTTVTGPLTLAAATYHSISITVVKGSATIAYGGGSLVAPEGYTNNMEASTLLANAVTITATAVGDIVAVTTIE